MKLLNHRANENGWDDKIGGVLWIPEDAAGQDSELHYLLPAYGQVTMNQIGNFERSYLGRQQRAALDNYMLYKCLINSLSKEARMKIGGWENEYIINNNQGTKTPSGNLLLKVIATTQSIRMKLSNLDNYILKIGSDITKFNGYVKILARSLEARGQKVKALLTHLFKGYLAASDKVFVRYINDKKDKYEEGKEVSADKLMQLADNKFRLLKERKEWDAPSPEEEKIMALEAAGEKLKKRKSNPKKKDKQDNTPKKQKIKSKGRFVDTPKPQWMHERPKEEDLSKTITWNGKEWWYCYKDTSGKCDGEYRRHYPKDCQGRQFKGQKSRNSQSSRAGKDKQDQNER